MYFYFILLFRPSQACRAEYQAIKLRFGSDEGRYRHICIDIYPQIYMYKMELFDVNPLESRIWYYEILGSLTTPHGAQLPLRLPFIEDKL